MSQRWSRYWLPISRHNSRQKFFTGLKSKIRLNSNQTILTTWIGRFYLNVKIKKTFCQKDRLWSKFFSQKWSIRDFGTHWEQDSFRRWHSVTQDPSLSRQTKQKTLSGKRKNSAAAIGLWQNGLIQICCKLPST